MWSVHYTTSHIIGKINGMKRPESTPGWPSNGLFSTREAAEQWRLARSKQTGNNPRDYELIQESPSTNEWGEISP